MSVQRRGVLSNGNSSLTFNVTRRKLQGWRAGKMSHEVSGDPMQLRIVRWSFAPSAFGEPLRVVFLSSKGFSTGGFHHAELGFSPFEVQFPGKEFPTFLGVQNSHLETLFFNAKNRTMNTNPQRHPFLQPPNSKHRSRSHFSGRVLHPLRVQPRKAKEHDDREPREVQTRTFRASVVAEGPVTVLSISRRPTEKGRSRFHFFSSASLCFFSVF